MKNMLLMIAVFGLIFLAIPMLSVVSDRKFREKALLTEGTVLEVKTVSMGKGFGDEIHVSFNTKEGKEETGVLRRKNSLLTRGSKIKIYYGIENTSDIRFTDTLKANITGILIGGTIFLLGLFFYIKMVIKDISRRKLVKTGLKISAENISVDFNRSFSSKGKNPFVIKCQWFQSMSGKQFTFISKDFWFDPKPHVSGRLHIDVYIDPNDPAKYYMDTSFMPKKG